MTGQTGPRHSGIAKSVLLLALLGLLASILLPPMLARPRKRPGAMEFQALEEALSGYYSIYSRYPPDSVAELGATEEYGTSESLYHYLVEGHGSKGTRKGHVYLETALLHAADIDGDGFPELVDAFGTPYLYAEGIGPSRTAAPVVRRAGMEPQGYDLVSAGPDRRLGGTFARSTGYVPARPGTTEEEYEEDNIAILGQRVPAQRAVQGLEGLE